VAIFEEAVRAGISPKDFWDLTPYLTRLAMGALHDGNTGRMWIQAALTRAKKLPKMEDLMGRKQNRNHPSQIAQKSKDLFLAHNAGMRGKRA
jgi:hypothetical protein